MLKPIKPSVTIIIPVYNVEHILSYVLESVCRQSYPIEKIILIDNCSPDQSVSVAKKYISRHRKHKIQIIERKKTHGVSASYNLGASLSKSEYIVTLHSDSVLPSRYELANLMKPFIDTSGTDYVAAMPKVVHRKQEWDQYNFWQKCLFAHVVGKEVHSLNGKFDAYRRSIFLSLGGYDTEHFNHFVGSEDADMHFRLKRVGRIAETDARVVHVHGNDPSYSLRDWIARRRFLSISYGRQIFLHWKEMRTVELAHFFIKPTLVVFSFLALWHWVLFLPMAVFPFVYMRNMFLYAHTESIISIVTLPFVIIYLVYAETMWMIVSIFELLFFGFEVI